MRKILLFGSLSSISANLRFIHSSNYSDLNFYCYCIFTYFEIVPPLNHFISLICCALKTLLPESRYIQNLPHEMKLTKFSLLNFITSLYIESSITLSGMTLESKKNAHLQSLQGTTLKSQTGIQNTPIDVNFHLQKIWEFLKNKSADKI